MAACTTVLQRTVLSLGSPVKLLALKLNLFRFLLGKVLGAGTRSLSRGSGRASASPLRRLPELAAAQPRRFPAPAI